MAKKFSSGDVVKLKSGGPKMTVHGYDRVGRVICKWFDGETPKRESFAEESLKLDKDN